MASRQRFRYGYAPSEQVKPVNSEIRQYFDPELPMYGPWSLWQIKSELPSTKEILGTENTEDSIQLTPNCIDGPWKSKEDYMKSHYELLREDSVSPLRRAVGKLRDDPHMKDTKDISIYEKVFITGITASRSGLALHIRFSTRRAGKNIAWTYSNRLTPGAIVALTPKQDAFTHKCVVAVVACRLPEYLEKDPPEVDIFLASPEDMEIDPQQEWIMVEHRVGYYEASRHTMTALQKLSKESFPLNEQVCSMEEDIDAPEYLKTAPNMDFSPLSYEPGLDITNTYNIIERWPSQPIGRLDASQWSALNEMLTKRLAVVQGPPGTGKTFTSMVALRMMLWNRRPNDPPIIVAAQTNHALDQFLRNISEFESNWVRLGGRTTDPDVRKRTPHELRHRQARLIIEGGLMEPAKRKQNKIAVEIEKILKCLAPSNSQKPIAASLFRQHNLLSKEQFESLSDSPGQWERSKTLANADPLTAWLGDCTKEFQYKYSGDFGFVDDDIDLEYEQLREIEVEHGKYEDDWASFKTRFIPFKVGLCGNSISRYTEGTLKKQLQETDLWNIHRRYRGPIYDYLRKQLLDILREEVCRLAKNYENTSRKFQIGRYERDYCVLEGAKIVGMTTTGLSKYRALVSSLKPRVILIEEAAEVIEAPIAVACLPTLEHLILVGDHQQLRGQCANHELAGSPFHLDMSMFERLIINQMPYKVLQEQRRMLPEIRSLLAPIYGNLLRDHASVGNQRFVPGMGTIRSFFFDHREHESNDSLASKVNDFEASMVVQFLAYLVLNGVPPERITILTFYNGQRKLILRKKTQNPVLATPYVKILTVDSYQGEENEIIILSLVRSNEHRGIGFLAQDNRLCVALSRARYGLFIFGNAQCVTGHSDFLHAVVDAMSEEEPYYRIGRGLPLYCKQHSQKTVVKTLKDWDRIDGGCDKPCDKPLPCGHLCFYQCHRTNHDWLSCKLQCNEIRPCCGKPCICICSPPHEHDCLCPEGKQTKVQVYKPGVEWEGSYNPEAKSESNDDASRISSSKSAAEKPANPHAKSLQRWKDFADGGARVDDYRRAGIPFRGGRVPEVPAAVEAKASATIKPKALIELNKDDRQAAIGRAEELQHTAIVEAKERAENQPCLIDLEDEYAQTDVVSTEGSLRSGPEQYQLSTPTEEDHGSLATEGDVTAPAEGILIDLF
ncbi:hypothetical protein N7457_001726 [Penicillium paradoxum]|uniref:uncharacterized protein n=1 Tax=Penicillium paradoxum TaxID=176176 RepID=UPI0025469701|nr:uncharacterized protein N7457_001726 [Penicillium paradoxum]KAJ5795127.1 hypothetical protein N7457_001726 [Penicillium paradoxum]